MESSHVSPLTDVVPPRTRGRRQRAPETREAVCEAVRDLLRIRRLDELTVNEIVERASISRPTFYAHFDTKYSVVAALIQDVGDGILGVWSPLFDGEGPLEEQQIREVGMSTIQRWRRQGALFTATVEGWHTDGEIHDAWSDILERFTEALSARVRRSGREHFSHDLLVSALVTLFERSLYLAVSSPDSVFARSDEELATVLAQIWAKMLGPS